MAGLTVSYQEPHGAALRAWGLVECFPCNGRGWVNDKPLDLPSGAAVYKNGKLIETEGGWSSVACTLCKGKGRILPPGCYGRLVVAKNPFPGESTGVKILAHKSRYGIKAIGWPLSRPPEG